MAEINKELLLKLLEDSKSELSENLIKNLIKNETESLEIIDFADYTEKLKNLKSTFEEKNIFKVGDIISWKAGMKNKRFPKYNQPGIILKILEKPIIDSEKDSGSTYFQETLDIQVGFIGSRNDFVTFFHDSNRFQLFKSK